VRLSDAGQAGVSGSVSVLHHIRAGLPWLTGFPWLKWDVVESLPVCESIKPKGKDYHAHIQTYRTSLEALAEAGVSTIFYNFRPIQPGYPAVGRNNGRAEIRGVVAGSQRSAGR